MNQYVKEQTILKREIAKLNLMLQDLKKPKTLKNG